MDINKLLMVGLSNLITGDVVEASFVFSNLADEIAECECPSSEEIIETIILVLQENEE
jgi:hypothetical protein